MESPNRDTRAAWRYHDGTKHSYESIRRDRHYLDWPNQPLAFKIYTTLDPIPLPKAFETGGPKGLLDLPTLARLLYFSAGVTRVRDYPGGQILFRAAACTGALYHIELYVACGRLPDLSAGLYHFSAHDFALRRLREGDFRGFLGEASGDDADVAAADVVLIFTSTFWRNSWKYQSRAYRHSFWDSGTILANLFAIAEGRAVAANLVLGFVDEQVNHLLGVDASREAALGLVPLGRSAKQGAGRPPSVEPIRFETKPLSYSEVEYPAIHEMHTASSLTSTEEARAWKNAGTVVAPLAASLAREPMEDVIRRRGSTRQFAREPISLEELKMALEYATRGIASDFGSHLTTPYVVANAVEGLVSGAYVYDRAERALVELKRGDFRSEAGQLDLGQELGADAAVNVYMLLDLAPILERFGNRGYRAAQLEGAVLGGKLYLAAYAQRFGATGLTFFDDEVTRFFSPRAGRKSVMFLCALGRPARRR